MLYYTIHNYFLHTLVHGKHLLTVIIKHLHYSQENNFYSKGETEIPHTHISMLNVRSAVCWNVGHPLLFSKQNKVGACVGTRGLRTRIVLYTMPQPIFLDRF